MELSGTRWSSIVVVDHQHHIASILLFRLDKTPAHAFRWLLVYLDFSPTPNKAQRAYSHPETTFNEPQEAAKTHTDRPKPDPVHAGCTWGRASDRPGRIPGLIREEGSWPLGSLPQRGADELRAIVQAQALGRTA